MPDLALGTAQFGLNYGITNVGGQVTTADATLLLQDAEDVGVTFIDTAQAYGNAEFVLCDALPANHSFRIISKLPPQSVHNSFDSASEACWQQSLEATIARMHVRQLDALLLHSSNDLRRQDRDHLLHWLRMVQHRGLVRRIGVSIYSADELEHIPLENLQVVQLPCSLYDQRLIVDGTVDHLRNLGIAVHARSLYLQGLLVTPPQHWPPAVPPALHHHHQHLTEWAQRHGWSLVQLALGWARRQHWMEAAVVGVTSVPELHELSQAWRGPDPWQGHSPESWAWPSGSDLDPRQWV